MTQKLSEIEATLTASNEKFSKAFTEIIAKIDALTASTTDVEVPAGVQAAIDALTATAQKFDDIVPDAPVPPVV